MKNDSLEIVIKKIEKYRWKIITNEKIKEVLITELWENYNDKKMYKIVYYLKLRWYLINLKKNLFYVKFPNDSINEEDLANKIYRRILWKQKKEICTWKRYIGWLKALEISLGNYSSPDEIIIVNTKKQCNETIIFEKKVFFKTYKIWEKNLFSAFSKFTSKTIIDWNNFLIAKPELAILETLYNTSILQKAYSEELVKKRLRKNKKYIDFEIFETIIKKRKHNSSMNRLANIATGIDQELWKKLKTIIKKFWYII